MADTVITPGLTVEQWDAKFTKEWVEDSRFYPYTGKSENSVIQTKTQLSKGKGDKITFALVTRIQGDGTVNDDTLEGNEAQLPNYDDGVTVNQLRQAVRRGNHEQSKTLIDILDASRMMLKKWRMEKERDDIIDRMLCPNLDGVTTYANTSEADKDAMLAANEDRYLFGAAVGNNAANDHSAALTQIDATNDVATGASLELAKRIAVTTRINSQSIQPVNVKKNETYFVCFMPSLSFRDFGNDSSVLSAQRDAWQRGKDNPIFAGGDYLWKGVVVVEVPEMPTLPDVGDGGTVDVAPNILCGTQAVLQAWAKTTHGISNVRDFGNLQAAGIAETRGLKKAIYNEKAHGALVWYTSGQPDA